jgi:peptide/nickel transport system substrate-binding protein
MYRHVHTAPPAPSAANPRVPAQLDALVLAALAKDPGERPADAGVFRASLWAWLTATDARTLTGPAAVLPAEPADRLPLGKQTPAADPRATYGVGTALPSLPAQPAAPESPAQPAPPVPSIPSAPSAPSAPAAPSTAPPPSAYAHPGPYAPQHTPPPNGPRAPEHPAYSRSPHLPLPPPYQPATPPPVNLGHAAAVPPVPPARGWSTRRKVLTGVAGVAVAGITVSVVLATGALSGGGHPHHDPTPGPTHAVSDALARHGGVAGSGYNGGVNGVVRASSRKGGTVRIAADYLDTSMLDPADTYNTSDWNIQRLLLRKLVDYAPAPGDKGRKLLPDLATNTGEVSPDGLTWTYHLKSGLRFQDGSPITSKDIKYGVERTFDRSVHPGGPSYFPDLLDEGQNYPGPYKDPDPSKLGLHSVTTPDDSTIVFKLAKPDSDFPYILAMSIGAPVPQAADTDGGRGFETHLVASGPYQVGSYDPGKSLHLVRNPEWSQATDPIRTQLPDAFDVKVYATQDEVEQALLDGNADLDFAASLLSSGTQQEIVDDPGKKADTDAAYSGATRFLSLQTDVAPFSNADCRKAVEFAVDRSAVRTALGGQYAGGDVATTMLPPTDDSYDPSAAPYTGHDGTPDIAAAKTHLAACGKPGGFSVTLASVSSTTSRSDAAVQAIADSLARVGITVKLKKLSATDFYDTLLDPAKLKKSGWGIAYTSWAADWPTGGGFLRELVEPGGAANYPGLRDTQLTGMVDQADDQTTPAAAAQEWTKIDARLMQDAVYVPLVYDRHLVYRGPHLTNVYQHQVIGGIDLSALGAV